MMIKLKKYLFRNFNVGTMFKLQWIYNASLCKIGGCTSYDWIMWEKFLFYKQWNLEHPNIDIIGWIEKDWISWFVVCVKKSIYGDAQPTTNNRFAPHMFWTQQNYHKILLRAGQLDINICRILLLSVNTQHLAFNIHKCMWTS